MDADPIIDELSQFKHELGQVEERARETSDAAGRLSIEVEDMIMELNGLEDGARAGEVLSAYLGRVEELSAQIMGYDAGEKFERLVRALQ